MAGAAHGRPRLSVPVFVLRFGVWTVNPSRVPSPQRARALAPMAAADKAPGWRLVFVGRRMQLFGIYRWRQSDGEPANWERHATQFGHDEE